MVTRILQAVLALLLVASIATNALNTDNSQSQRRRLRTVVDEPLVGGEAGELDTTYEDEYNIRITTSEGRKLFEKLLERNGPVLDLLSSLETQMNLGACAPASAVTVLNAMDYRKPYDPTYTSYMGDAYAFWTQTAFAYDPCVKKYLNSHVFGETLEGFGAVLKCLGLNVEIRHGDGSQKLADSLKSHLDANHFVIVNFERAALHQKAGGHFSPVAGYVDDRVLLLDVARYKYTPSFVPIADMIQGMSRVDLQSGMARGFVAVWKKK